MQAIEVLAKLLDLDKRIATFLFAGLGILAVVAIGSSFGIDLHTALIMGAYLIGLTLALYVFVFIAADTLIQRVLAWFMTAIIIMIVGVLFVASVFPNQQFVAPSYCLVRFWERCAIVAATIADETTAAKPAAVPSAKPATAPSTSTDVRPSNYQVFVQFAGIISRDDVRSMMGELRNAGWNVQGVEGGGQRTADAIGLNLVRYRSDEDKAAASALASAVETFKLSNRALSTERNSRVSTRSLEVWISR